MRVSVPRTGRLAVLTATLATLVANPCPAIEMFTYFGDGSRIGLPNLEVPVEAYPGIPLRSDRLRARRRAMRMGPGAAARIGPPGYARGITIRSLPAGGGTLAAPAGQIRVVPPIAEPAAPIPGADLAEDVTPPAPDPDDTLGE